MSSKKNIIKQNYYSNLRNITIIGLCLCIFIVINLLMLIFPYFAFFGVTKPELWLIPIGVASLMVKAFYRMILICGCIISNFIFIPASLLLLTPWSIIFDYLLPYIFFSLTFLLINKKYQYTWMIMGTIIINLLVYLSHTLSGYLFFTSGSNSTMPQNYKNSRVIFSLLYNLIYLPPTLILSVLIFPWIYNILKRKKYYGH